MKYISLCMLFLLISCQRNQLQLRVNKECKNILEREVDPVIDISSLTWFEWDTMYYYSNKYSLDEIVEDLGMSLTEYTDIGDRVIFFNKGKIIYIEEWFPYFEGEKAKGGITFGADKMYIPLTDAKFTFEKVNRVYLLRHISCDSSCEGL